MYIHDSKGEMEDMIEFKASHATFDVHLTVDEPQEDPPLGTR